MNNLSSYCGLVDAKIRAADKDLPLQPFTTQSLGLNVCKVNPEHQLMVCGSNEGRIEAWDPRSRQRAATLDSAFSLIQGKYLNIKCIIDVSKGGQLPLHFLAE